MKNITILENISTKNLIPISLIIVVVTPLLLSMIIELDLVSKEKLSTIIDSSVKIIALLIGFLWFMNRYFVHRIDFPQIQIEGYTNRLSLNGENSKSAINYNVQITNKGKTLIKKLNHAIELQKISVVNNEIEYKTIYRFPEKNYHTGNNIEPESWIALNDSLIVDKNTSAIRIYLKMNIDEYRDWTWHKDFQI